MFYCIRIDSDSEIPNTVSNNKTIPEELGRIQFLLSDKTGTLTQNDMIFKKLSLKGDSYTYEEVEKIGKIVKNQTIKTSGPCEDIVNKVKKEDTL